MALRHGRACGLCMLSKEARVVFSIDWLRKMAERKTLSYYNDCTIAEQSVVDKRITELSSRERVIRAVLVEGMIKGNFSALILCGDTLTEFGRMMLTVAKEEALPVHLKGFGDTPFGRRYRLWHSPRAAVRQSRRTAGVWSAVDEAEREGIHIC